MGTTMQTEQRTTTIPAPEGPNWVRNASVLWAHRRSIFRATVVGVVASILLVLLIPNRYESTARIMPPESSGSSAALLAALAGRGGGEFTGIGNLAASLLGVRTTGPLFVDLLRSATISGDLIDRFQLQQVYGKRYRFETAKKLARRTAILEDKKSGVISITVEDSDPQRARDLAKAYLDELNLLVNRTNTSSARQERLFIERRLQDAESGLEGAQKELSDFSSTHSTIDIKEQTRATVDAAAKLQAQIVIEQTELDSLLQIYGDENVRVRAARARIAGLKSQLAQLAGTSDPLQPDGNMSAENSDQLNRTAIEYPPLRQIPRLAVPYANIYRHLRVQEAVYEMLTQQYELARIQEAKDVPVIRVIDAPGIPEKKSFPPRALFAGLLSGLVLAFLCTHILVHESWKQIDAGDPRKVLIRQIAREAATYKRYLNRKEEYSS